MVAQSTDTFQDVGGQRHDRLREEEIPVIGEDTDRGEINVSLPQKMLSATTGSLLTSLLVTPLDVVRVRLQSQHPSTSISASKPPPAHIQTAFNSHFSNLPRDLGISSCCREVFWVNNNASYCVASSNIAIVTNPTAATSLADCAAAETQRKTFTTTFDGLKKIARNEGARTLWRGLSPTLAMAIPANVIYFAGYDWLRYSSSSPFSPPLFSPTYAPLLAGSSARVLAAIAVSPIEMFRTRMQASRSATTSGHFRDTVESMKQMVAERGFRSLWTGLTLTLWRDVPFSAIYWWGYEYGRERLLDVREEARGRKALRENTLPSRQSTRSRSRENHTSTLVDSFIAGAASGAVAAFVTTPFDVGKTRQQVVQYSKSSAAQSVSGLAAGSVRPEEMSMPRFLLHIYQSQGMSGLFKGWAARCLKVAPACAIMISSYEVGKKMAGNINERRERKRYAEE